MPKEISAGKTKFKAPKPKTKSSDKPMKRFTNGHKTFTSDEAGALIECMAREVKSRVGFRDKRFFLERERNTILAEYTDRGDYKAYLIDDDVYASTVAFT